MKSEDAHTVLAQVLSNQLYAQALSVAARLGIADLLVDGPRDVEGLASATGSHAPTLYRMLRALASMGVFVEVEGRRFGLAPPARLILRGSAMRAMSLLVGDEWRAAAYQLLAGVRTGRPAFEHAFGTTLYEYLARHAEAQEAFDQTMADFWAGARAAVLDAYDFSPFRRIIDVGGGTGGLLTAILERCPRSSGVLLDTPAVIERAAGALARAPCAARCEVLAGDFFQSVPPGGDLYVLSFVVHNWDDDRVAALLRRCRDAMSSESKLVLIEGVIPSGTEPSYAKVLDLEMLVFTPGGRERTEADFRALLERSGLALERIVATASSASVIEALPAG